MNAVYRADCRTGTIQDGSIADILSGGPIVSETQTVKVFPPVPARNNLLEASDEARYLRPCGGIKTEALEIRS